LRGGKQGSSNVQARAVETLAFHAVEESPSLN
jgi:hypothetical protein